MFRVRHPLLDKALRIAAELTLERTACDVCSSRGVMGSSGPDDEPEPCPACLGVSYLWIDPRRGLLNVEELVEEYGV